MVAYSEKGRFCPRERQARGTISANIGSYPASQGPTPDPTRPPASGGLLDRDFRCLSGLRPDGTPAPRRPSDVTATVLPGCGVRRPEGHASWCSFPHQDFGPAWGHFPERRFTTPFGFAGRAFHETTKRNGASPE